jgi:hypothetical protein
MTLEQWRVDYRPDLRNIRLPQYDMSTRGPIAVTNWSSCDDNLNELQLWLARSFGINAICDVIMQPNTNNRLPRRVGTEYYWKQSPATTTTSISTPVPFNDDTALASRVFALHQLDDTFMDLRSLPPPPWKRRNHQSPMVAMLKQQDTKIASIDLPSLTQSTSHVRPPLPSVSDALKWESNQSNSSLSSTPLAPLSETIITYRKLLMKLKDLILNDPLIGIQKWAIFVLCMPEVADLAYYDPLPLLSLMATALTRVDINGKCYEIDGENLLRYVSDVRSIDVGSV